VSVSGLRLPALNLGSCGTMTLQGFSFGSAAEVLDGDASEEDDGIEEGFGFGDGYDFCASAGTHEVLPEAFSDEAVSVVAVEVDVGEVGIEI